MTYFVMTAAAFINKGTSIFATVYGPWLYFAKDDKMGAIFWLGVAVLTFLLAKDAARLAGFGSER